MVIRVAVVDDHPLFRDGVVATVNGAPEFEVVAQGENGGDAVRIALHEGPGIMLLDVCMPGNGIDAAREISAITPSVRTVVLTALEGIEAAAPEAGARESIPKGGSGGGARVTLSGRFR